MKITVEVQSAVAGPHGIKLKVGQVVTLDDSPYVRVLLKSGNVALIDPPSLEDDYLVKVGLKEAVPAPKVEEKVETPVPAEEELPAKAEEKSLSEKIFAPAKKAAKAEESKDSEESNKDSEEV